MRTVVEFLMLAAMLAAVIFVSSCARTKYVIVPVLSGTGACECERTKPDTVMCLAECTKASCEACADALPTAL